MKPSLIGLEIWKLLHISQTTHIYWIIGVWGPIKWQNWSKRDPNNSQNATFALFSIYESKKTMKP